MQIAPRADVARFSDALERLGAGDAKILLAVSGGADSLAMLLLAHAAIPAQIVAATVDHKLRPEASAEADYVAKLCAGRRTPHRILRPETPITGNIQSAARTARYELLMQAADETGCAFIATAHHGDDQIETVLMRLARGSGVDGLSAIRPRNGRIIRPLLEFSKSELEEICNTAGIAPVCDPSNDDTDYDRVVMRQWLASTPHPFNVARVGRTAAAVYDASTALQWMTEQLAATRVTQIEQLIQCDANDLPHELQRRLALLALAHVDPDLHPRGDTVERMIADLAMGKTSTVGNILCEGGNVWRFSPAPPRRSV